MEIIRAVLLGIVQGVTEFLPVSSSGHLLLLKDIFAMDGVPLLFDVLMHIATLLVVIGFFRMQIWYIIRALAHGLKGRAGEDDRYYLRLTVVLIIGTAVTAGLGLYFETVDMLHTPRSVSVLFIFTGLVLVSTKFTHPAAEQEPRYQNGLWIGIAQGLGTLPGISRSGITISSALWLGIDRKRAGELSFIISIPAIIGALILTGGDAGALAEAMSPGAVAAGFIAALVSGYLSLRMLIWLIGSGRLYYFSIYLIPLGIIGLVLL